MRQPGLPPGAPGDFFESLRRLRVLGVVPRPRRELAEAERPQLPPDRRRAHRHPELLPQPLHEVDQPPAHHPVAPGLGAGLHRTRQRRALLRRQRRRLARGLAVDQPVRTFGVEAHHPVPHDLQPDPADPRRLRPGPAIADRRQRQQPPNLLRVPAGSGQPPQIITSEVTSKLDRRRHGKPSPVFHDESRRDCLGNLEGSVRRGVTLAAARRWAAPHRSRIERSRGGSRAMGGVSRSVGCHGDRCRRSDVTGRSRGRRTRLRRGGDRRGASRPT